MNKKPYGNGKVLKQDDYDTINELIKYGLKSKQIHGVVGWSKSTIDNIRKSTDYEDYRQRNNERLKKPDIAQKKEEITNIFPDPELNRIYPTPTESLLRIACAVEELVEAVKARRRIL